MDESIGIHEWVGYESNALLPNGSRKGTFFRRTGIWVIVVGAPFVVLFFSWAYSIRKHFGLQPGAYKKFVVGMVILLTGSLGLEVLNNLFEEETLSYIALVFFEELFEMVGATTILWSIYSVVVGKIFFVTDGKDLVITLKSSKGDRITS